MQATGLEFAAGLAVDSGGDLYVGGGTSASDFPTTANAFQENYGGASNGLGDGWVAKLPLASNPPSAPADHYLCYKARGEPSFAPITSLVLTDPFENLVFSVKRRSLLCNPADKQGEGIVFPDVHLLDYKIKRLSGKHISQRNLEVVNQLGGFLYDTRTESGLLVPTSKSPTGSVPPPDPSNHGVDHHKCYKIKAAKGAPKLPKGLLVDLNDQFDQPATYEIVKPSRLCVPVDKAGEGIKNASGHLMCYRVKRTTDAHVAQTGLHVNNQLEVVNPGGPAVLETRKERELCVPSILGPVPAPTCGDGVVNQPSEQCDAPDELACPGVLCQADCTCAPAGVCGNGLAELPTEQCDGLDDATCPGECTSLCVCLGPRTFTIDPSTSLAQTSLGVNVPLSGSVELVITDEIAPGALAFDVPITQLPGVNLGALIGTICPFLTQDPALPPGIAGRGVLNCSGTSLAGTGFLTATSLTRFQDHCVEGAGAGICDSAPNPGGGVVHGPTGVLVPDGAVDPTCTLPGDAPDTNPSHAGACNGPSMLGVGTDPYLPGDSTLTLNVILDQRAAGDPCNPPPTPAAVPVKINFTTGNKRGGIMDLQGAPASVAAFDVTGMPFDCSLFLLENDASGASIVGIFPAVDVPLLGLRLDLLSAIRLSGQAPAP